MHAMQLLLLHLQAQASLPCLWQGQPLPRRLLHCDRPCFISFFTLQVVCSKCSTHKAKLAYDEYRENRVCDRCHYVINVQKASSSSLPRDQATSPTEKTPPHQKRRGPGVLQVSKSVSLITHPLGCTLYVYYLWWAIIAGARLRSICNQWILTNEHRWTQLAKALVCYPQGFCFVLIQSTPSE